MNACWPTETRPAYPASRFHMLAMISSVKKFTSRFVVPEYTRYGR